MKISFEISFPGDQSEETLQSLEREIVKAATYWRTYKSGVDHVDVRLVTVVPSDSGKE